MKDLLDLLSSVSRLSSRHQPYVIATVVNIRGSAYRRPGARMLIDGDRVVGAVSGGCLETDIRQRAAAVLASGKLELVTYDATTDDEIIMGLGLGCEGVVDILIERHPREYGTDYLQFLASTINGRQPQIIATVYRVSGSATVRAGDRQVVSASGFITSDLADAVLRQRLTVDARAALLTGKSVSRHYAIAAGAVDVLFEVVQPRPRLLVFGAGFDAVPVVELATALGWHVTVCDHRPTYADPARFPAATSVIVCRPEYAEKAVDLVPGAVAVVMTHNYQHDRELLQWLLRLPLAYVGILGPRRRTARLLEEVAQTMEIESTAHVHGPMGLDLGAETPQEVALSIVAEIQAVLQAREGGSLRRRKGAIH